MDVSGGVCTEGVSGFDGKGEWGRAAGADCCQNKWEEEGERANHDEAAGGVSKMGWGGRAGLECTLM